MSQSTHFQTTIMLIVRRHHPLLHRFLLDESVPLVVFRHLDLLTYTNTMIPCQHHYCIIARSCYLCTSAYTPYINSASPFSSRFTSSSTSQLISVIIHTLVIHHSFTLSLQAQNLPFQQILSTVDFFSLLDCLTITGLDRTYHAHHYGRQLSVSGRPCYILPMFFYFFMAALYGR